MSLQYDINSTEIDVYYQRSSFIVMLILVFWRKQLSFLESRFKTAYRFYWPS